MSAAHVWIWSFADALTDLGLEPGEAERIAAETSAQAQESGLGLQELFGPSEPYARAVVGALHAPIAAPEPGGGSATTSLPGAVLLSLNEVGKRYGRQRVFSGLNLTLRTGEVAAVVGANGCGKSTLLKICAGLIRASAGRVARCRRIGYVPQDGGLLGLLTPHEHFELFGAASGVPGPIDWGTSCDPPLLAAGSSVVRRSTVRRDETETQPRPRRTAFTGPALA